MLYNKLVRDKIPQIIRAQGEIPNTRILGEDEYMCHLAQKLDEEVHEYHEDRNAEELADILEVVFALGEQLGYSQKALLDAYQQKHDARGGFRDRIFLIGKETLTYHSASAADVETVYAMSKALIDTYEDIASIAYEKGLAWVRRKITDNIGEYTRVCMAGETVGYYRLHEEAGETELDDLYILPKYRGRGIGTVVLQKCLAEVKTPVFLYVFKENLGAIRLYTRMGFVHVQDVGQTRMILRREVDTEHSRSYNMVR